MINGVTKLFMTKADVLSGFATIKVCTSYNINGASTSEIPFENDIPVEPVYLEMDGWQEDVSAIREYEKLPGNLKKYISYIENYTGVPVTLVSVGPDRNETIIR